jgi:glycosyltransferase involved in cell wall biosynthesis
VIGVPTPDHAPSVCRISVCVSSRDRADRLGRLLVSLTRQTLPLSEFSVVVVDDGSTDGTAALLERVQRETVLDLTCLRSAVSQGPASGRNKAWRASTGAVVAFTDDDCVPSDDWLAQILGRVADGAHVVVGRVEPNPDQVSRLDRFAHTYVMRAAEMRWYATANVAYRRDSLEILGGFDQRYGNPACEDTDLGLRAEEAGILSVFAPNALVWHDVVPGSMRTKVQDQKRWADLTLIIREHPSARRELLHRGVFWKDSHPRLLLLLLGLAAAPRSRSALALTVPWIHQTFCRRPDEEPLPATVAVLPAILAVDLAEVAAMVRGSIRHRTVVL